MRILSRLLSRLNQQIFFRHAQSPQLIRCNVDGQAVASAILGNTAFNSATKSPLTRAAVSKTSR
jgi:hypothetical protein